MNPRLLLALACAVACALVASALARFVAAPPLPRVEADALDAASVAASPAAAVVGSRPGSDRDGLELASEPTDGRTDPRTVSEPAVTWVIEPVADGEARLRGVAVLPREATDRARVALFRARMGAPSGEALAQATAERDGRFVLTVEQDVREALLVVRASGARPETRAVELDRGCEAAAGAIALERGGTIEGSVRAGGEPLGRAEVVAVLVGERERYAVEGGALAWRGGRFELAYATADSARDGAYRIGGLVPERYDVRVSSMREGAVVGYTERPARRVDVPAQDVDFDCDVATLAFRFVSQQGSPDGIDVDLASERWRSRATTDARGRARFRLVAGSELRMTASKAGHELLALPFLAPRAGEEREEVLVLRASNEKVQLRILVEGRGIETPSRARVRGYRKESGVPGADEAEVFDVDVPIGRETALPALSRAKYRVEVEADSESYCPNSFVVDLGRESTRRVLLSERPRLQIDVYDDAGARIEAIIECRGSSAGRRDLLSKGSDDRGPDPRAALLALGVEVEIGSSGTERALEVVVPTCEGVVEVRAVTGAGESEWKRVVLFPGNRSLVEFRGMRAR